MVRVSQRVSNGTGDTRVPVGPVLRVLGVDQKGLEMANEHKTAMKRKAPSRPMLRLASDGSIVGEALDYGCGKGFDADTYGMASYDPYYQPKMPLGMFDTITCNYVLNTIESNQAKVRVLRDIQARLTDDGIAYITVRNDTRALRGTTSKGTYQCLVVLKLPVVYSCSGYVTYQLLTSDLIDSASLEARIYEND
jgi:hypothetical protein